jgi:hypothetical protein
MFYFYLLVNFEFDTMWKKAVMAYFNELSRNSLGGTE